MDLNRQELSELFALEFEKFAIFDFVYPLASPISTKLGHYIYAHKVLDEFDYGTNRTRPSGVICP